MVDVFEDDRRIAWNRLTWIDGGTEDESETEDCTAHPGALAVVLFGSEGADCKEEDREAISEEENRP